MAESGGQNIQTEVSLTEDIPPMGTSIQKRKNITSASADRIKNRLTRSAKRRPGTPEPDQKAFTDDSEKDISDCENLSKSGEILTKSKESLTKSKESLPEDAKAKQNLGIRRFFNRSKGKHDLGRSRSLERPPTKEPESEDDFETILRLHKNQEMEEEKREAEKLSADSKPKIKEELKEFVPKEMPPLIVAPKDTKKRRRHKSLPLHESQSEEEKPKTPLTNSRRKIIRRKPSTSEEEDFGGYRRGSEKREDSKPDLRLRKIDKQKENQVPKMESLVQGEATTAQEDTVTRKDIKPGEEKPGFFKKWFGGRKTKVEEKPKAEEKAVEKVKEKTERRWIIVEVFHAWREHVSEHRNYYESCMRLKNRCITDLIILLMLCGFGGIVFRFTEGAFESFYKCGVKRVKRDFIDTLWKYSQYMLEEDWKSNARRKLMEFENQLHSAHEAGMTTYSGQKSWSFLNAVVYCLTVVTTIGYGHISPSTNTGRAITIIYAIFGIPMFLILLADFGKLFTRGIKFVWAFVRRLYYTGSCRRVRKTAPVQEVMKGVQIMYDFAKSRRLTAAGVEVHPQSQHHLRPPDPNMHGIPETPGTPNWSVFEIDDEFNLPITVAFSILLIYIFFGAFLYWIWEEWSFFESFYFVFISMSTIGFGDFVPQSPMYMMLSIVYLIFGLALTSMCINVVQEKLSDTFRQASVKLGTTIGLRVVEETGVNPEIVNPEPNNLNKI